VDVAWRDMFSDAKVCHIASSCSDHSSVLVELRCLRYEGTRIFRYEIMWARVESLPAEIKKVWCAASDRGSLGSIVHVLGNMRSTVHQWSKQHFGSITEELNKLR
jgi:hypothetical protein